MQRFPKKHLTLFVLFSLSFSIGITMAFLKNKLTTENSRFQRFLTELFKEEVCSDTITLHYTLANPSSFGIRSYPITLGTFSADDSSVHQTKLQSLQNQLTSFAYEDLSLENQLIYDTLTLLYATETELLSFPFYFEPLSPTLGIQAQLPILLAEYTFRCEQDLKDYLHLLSQIPSYFESILQFEKEKAQKGLFMNNETAIRIIAQCKTFSGNSKNHYLLSVFQDKLKNCSFLSKRKKEQYLKQHEKQVLSYVLPAYEMLSSELLKLLGSGKNPYGLYYFPEGKKYYLSVLRASTGIYDSIESITDRLYLQMHSDYLQIHRLLTAYPNLPQRCKTETTASALNMTPKQMLSHLNAQLTYDFPSLKKTAYSIHYVHKDLAKYLSPAFYLTPPIDTLSPNAIYINPLSKQTNLSLYATLAHEGFPGHMYQTLSFAQKKPHPIRHLLSNGGFIEGWATYIESYAYQYAPVAHEIGEYMNLQRSFYLCVYSLLDIYIHYYGWKMEDAAAYLDAIGITSKDSQKEIYQILLEDPGNYLKYCLGSLSIKELKSETQKRLGVSFETKDFHEALLTIGPVPFPVFKKYLPYYLNE